MEECFFFRNNGYDLFGFLNTPNKSLPNRKIGIVFCAPFAEEKLWSHRLFVNFSRYLMEKGFSILRFDYMGHGDSEGDFEHSDVQSNLSDIQVAVDFFKTKTGIENVGLLGLRYGATLACMMAEKKTAIDFLILWEPIINLRQYLLQCLRSNLTTQMVTYKKILYTREQMVDDLESGKSVNIDGYILSAEFYKQAVSIDLTKENIHFSKPVQILNISKTRKDSISSDMSILCEKYKKQSGIVDACVLIEKPFWGDLKEYFQISERIFDLSSDFLCKLAK